MDFSESLIRIQGALITLNRTNGLRKIENVEKGIKSRNSAFFNAIETIFDAYRQSDSDLRKIHLYLMLNSDFGFNDEIAKDENFCHIVFTAPTLDKFLFAETILLLDFRKYIWETIVFGDVNVSLEYLDALLHEIPPEKSVVSVSAVEVILTAVHQRLAVLEVDSGALLGNTEIAKSKFSYCFKELVNTFSTPHDDYLMGYVVKSLMSVLCSCMDQRCNPAIAMDESCKLYSISLPYMKVDSPTKDYINFSKNEDIRCILSVFESNLSLVSLSTWMYWCECKWESPTDLMAGSKTLQEIVGEQAFLCQQRVQKFCKDLPGVETLSAVLASMAIKPVSEDDEIEKTHDLGQMLPKLNESNRSLESKQKWLRAILTMPWPLNLKEFVECMEQVVTLLSSWEDVHLLLQKAAEMLKSCDSTFHPSEASTVTQNGSSVTDVTKGSLKENIKKLMFQAFPKISVEEQGKLVGIFYKDSDLSNLFLIEDFEKIATETFNKAVSIEENKDELLSEFCVLCLQSPLEVVHRLLVLGIGCYSQIEFVMEVLNMLSSLCQVHVDERTLSMRGFNCKSHDVKITLLCLQLSILMKQNNWNETEISSFVSLVERCLDASILQYEHFLLDCLFPGIEYGLKTSSWAVVDLHIEILNVILTNSSFPMRNTINPAAILAYILTVLEKGKTEMRTNFSVGAASTCESIISYLPVILEKIADPLKSEEKYSCWLKNRVLSASPLSQYYYHRLWPGIEDGVCKDYKYLLMLKIYKSSEVEEPKMLDLLTKHPSHLCHFLYELLPSCTTSEWLNIAHVCKGIIPQVKERRKDLYFCLFNIISSVVMIMITAAKKKVISDNKEVLYCIELWFKNFVRIIKEEFWPCHKYFNTRESCDVFLTIINLLAAIPEDENIQETCGFLALSILSGIIDAVLFQESVINSKGSNCCPHSLKLTTCISLMNDGETKKGLARKMYENLHS